MFLICLRLGSETDGIVVGGRTRRREEEEDEACFGEECPFGGKVTPSFLLDFTRKSTRVEIVTNRDVSSGEEFRTQNKNWSASLDQTGSSPSSSPSLLNHQQLSFPSRRLDTPPCSFASLARWP